MAFTAFPPFTATTICLFLRLFLIESLQRLSSNYSMNKLEEVELFSDCRSLCFLVTLFHEALCLTRSPKHLPYHR